MTSGNLNAPGIMTETDLPLRFGRFTLSQAERVVRYRGQACALAPKAVDLLAALATTPNTYIGNDDLIASVWPDSDVYDANLSQTIYVLRAFLRANGNEVRIENLPKRGYRLVVCDAPEIPTARIQHPPIARWAIMGVLAIASLAIVAWRVAPPSPRQPSAKAMQAYLLATHDEALGTPAHLTHAATLFARVIALAPRSALGYAGASEAATSLSFYATTEQERARFQARAITLADRALSLDPQSSAAYAARGAVAMAIHHDESRASRDFTKAIQLDANNVLALVWEGTIRLHRGNIADGRDLLARAVALAPDVPGTVASLAWASFLAGDYQESIALSRQMLHAHQFPTLANTDIANADIELHRYADARQVLHEMANDPSARIQRIAIEARIDALSGHRWNAITRLQTLDATIDPTTVGTSGAIALAAAYLALGDAPRMRAWLARVDITQRSGIRRDPRFAEKHSAARFESFLKLNSG